MNSKKMTFDDIVRAKLQKENDKLTVKSIKIPSIGKELVFRRPKDDAIFDFIDSISESQKTSNMKSEFQKIIYLCCDDLHTSSPTVMMSFASINASTVSNGSVTSSSLCSSVFCRSSQHR